MNKIFISRAVYNNILSLLSTFQSESGGILGLNESGIIAFFVFDKGRDACPYKYVPDTANLNKILENWEENGIRFCGFVHSHPAQCPNLSPSDLLYGMRILSCFPKLDYLLLGLYCDGNIRIFSLDKSGKCIENTYSVQ